MRRGRIFIYLALILIVGLGLVYIYFQNRGGLGSDTGASDSSGPQLPIIVASRSIPRGTSISAEDLSTISVPADNFVPGQFIDNSSVIGRYAKNDLDQGMVITESDISMQPTVPGEAGSPWAYNIPPGMTAVSIPISELTSVAYGIRDGDHINIIASMLVVDVDANFQTKTPNLTAGLSDPGGEAFLLESGSFQSEVGTNNLTAQTVQGPQTSVQGRVELDPNFQEPFYLIPAESQRPRLVTQMVLQNVLVLHIGTFELPNAVAAPATDAGVGVEPVVPDIITLVVTPQEAVTLTYLLNSSIQMTLTLRGPSDDVSRVETEAATLQYLLSMYQIPVPPKLPYSIEPRINSLEIPVVKEPVAPSPTE